MKTKPTKSRIELHFTKTDCAKLSKLSGGTRTRKPFLENFIKSRLLTTKKGSKK